MSARVRRRLLSVVALTATAVVGGVVHANAPPTQYLPFEQGDACISDQQTQLTWTRAPQQIAGQPALLNFNDALAACANLVDAGAGAAWRVPSLNELETLVDEVPHTEIVGGVLTPKAIDANAFPKTPVDHQYWTSSVVPLSTYAWVVYFNDGSTSTDLQSTTFYVRCVADWVNGAPPLCPSPSN